MHSVDFIRTKTIHVGFLMHTVLVIPITGTFPGRISRKVLVRQVKYRS